MQTAAKRHGSVAAHKVQDGASLIYIRVEPQGGHVLVVKATLSGKALWVTSLRRMHRRETVRDSEIRRLLGKGEG